MGFIGKTKRTASVIADGDTIVEMITRDAFMGFVDKLPRNERTRLSTMASDFTSIAEIYGRLIVLLQDMNARTKMIGVGTVEKEAKEIPGFIHHIITAMDRRHSVAVEGINKLSLQLERRHTMNELVAN